MLNSSKGPAVKSLRAQGDKITYPKNMVNELKKLEILHVDNYQYIEIKKLNKDEYLLHQGEKLNYIYILLRGKVKRD